jgi:hypothetical protein
MDILIVTVTDTVKVLGRPKGADCYHIHLPDGMEEELSTQNYSPIIFITIERDMNALASFLFLHAPIAKHYW